MSSNLMHVPGLLVENDSCTASGNTEDFVTMLVTLSSAVGVITMTACEGINQVVSRLSKRI